MLASIVALIAAAAPLDVKAVSADHQPAHLSALLETRSYTVLVKTLAAASTLADAKSDLDWEKKQMLSGSSVFVSIPYSVSLWRAASHLTPAVGDSLRKTAVFATLYALAAVSVDGARCADVSAPGRRIDQLITGIPDMRQFAMSLPEQERKRLVDLAVTVERKTVSARQAHPDDAFICTGGLEEMEYDLKHASQSVSATTSGLPGKTVTLTGDIKYVPRISPESEWRTQAEVARTALPGILAKLMGLTH